MAEFAFAIPVVPGKEELDRKTLGEMSGARATSTRRRRDGQASRGKSSGTSSRRTGPLQLCTSRQTIPLPR